MSQIASLALLNTTQAYRTRRFAFRTYEGPVAQSQVTDFGSRMFGTWTFLSCVVRLYAAYKIDVPEVYMLTLWTFVIAMVHFGTEWMVFGTMRAGKGLAPVMVVPVVSIAWMIAHWGFYVG